MWGLSRPIIKIFFFLLRVVVFVQLNQQPNSKHQENDSNDKQRSQIGFHNSIPFSIIHYSR